jgi:hypothetical protein
VALARKLGTQELLANALRSLAQLEGAVRIAMRSVYRRHCPPALRGLAIRAGALATMRSRRSRNSGKGAKTGWAQGLWMPDSRPRGPGVCHPSLWCDPRKPVHHMIQMWAGSAPCGGRSSK